jgi:hypothetical protein
VEINTFLGTVRLPSPFFLLLFCFLLYPKIKKNAMENKIVVLTRNEDSPAVSFCSRLAFYHGACSSKNIHHDFVSPRGMTLELQLFSGFFISQVSRERTLCARTTVPN